MADTQSNPVAENVVIESGVDTSRPVTELVPDRLLIGGSRDGKRKTAASSAGATAAPVVGNQADDNDDALNAALGGDDDDAPSKTRDDSADDAAAQNANAKEVQAAEPELTDDDLMDILLEEGEFAPQGQQRQATQQQGATVAKPTKPEHLEPGLKAEYDGVVDKYGVEMANNLILPRLLREQALNASIAGVLEHQSRSAEQQQQQAQREVQSFFTDKAAAGYAKVYGEGEGKTSPLQIEAMRRVIAKAVSIKEKVEAAGIQITPKKAMERAHEAIWGKTKIGQSVASRQATMQNRAGNTTLQTNRPASGQQNNSANNADPYAKVRQRLKASGWAQ